MSIYAALRVKDEARWIERVIKSIHPVCAKIVVFDDHSTDKTVEICRELGCIVLQSTFQGIDEARDKDYLLGAIWTACGAQLSDWVLMIDGDEELHQADIPAVIRGASSGAIALSFHVVYLWDREDQIRVDRWYKENRRGSMFRLTSRDLSFVRTAHGGNFHCSNTPWALYNQQVPIQARLLHYGYLHKADRVRKYEWYNRIDPNNPNEDGYRHMVIGDIFPADSVFRYAGPLELKPL